MLKQILCSTALLCIAGYANAGIVTQNFTVEKTTTNFKEQVEYELFDTLGGQRKLESVEITLLAKAEAHAEAENRSRSSADTVTATVSAIIALIDLAGDIIIEAAPSESSTKVLAVYDGVSDFDGPSGSSFVGLDASETVSKFFTDTASLLAFIDMGTSTSSVEFDASALSKVTGGGNLMSGISTFSSGAITIEYKYSDSVEVSAPAHLALLGMGLLTLAGLRKFKA